MSIPRRHRMKRAARLQSAKHWIPTYGGKRIVLGYKRWYAVDRLCAIIELRMLGVSVPESEVTAAREAQEQARLRRAARKDRLNQQHADDEATFSNWLADQELDALDCDDDDDGGLGLCRPLSIDDEIPF